MKNLLKVMAAVVALAFLAVSCGVVSFTGRKQILLFSDSEISALSDQSYADFMKTAQVSSNADAARMLKGVGEDYDLSFFRQHLKEGVVPEFSAQTSSNQILISREVADKLQLGIGDKVDSYFLQGALRARRYTVAGIYETGFAEYDRLFVLTDLKAVQALNRWEPTQVTGVEIMLTDFGEVEPMNWRLGSLLDRTEDPYGE
jgi:lipoprotein-releasing system permease protein